MEIKNIQFIKSSPNVASCPDESYPEFAFAGRSNVGKSTLINYLLGRLNLAKTSQTPGKTRLINHFLVNDSWYLVDLPGFGYAKVSKSGRRKIGEMLNNYLMSRQNLLCVFMLVDARHKPLRNDIEFINRMGDNQIPFVLVYTKSDKLSKSKVEQNIKNYKQELSKYWEEIPEIFITSATKKFGRDKILQFIAKVKEDF